MERLTMRDPFWLGEELWTSAMEPDDEEIDAVYEKLKHYEDMEERLEKVYGDCQDMLKIIISYFETHKDIDIRNTEKSLLLTNDDVDKYLILKQLLKSGKLIELPCNYDEHVWFIKSAFSIACVPIKAKIVSISLCSNNDIHFRAVTEYTNISRSFYKSQIGKTVFLTSSEAKKALKEIKNEVN